MNPAVRIEEDGSSARDTIPNRFGIELELDRLCAHCHALGGNGRCSTRSIDATFTLSTPNGTARFGPYRRRQSVKHAGRLAGSPRRPVGREEPSCGVRDAADSGIGIPASTIRPLDGICRTWRNGELATQPIGIGLPAFHGLAGWRFFDFAAATDWVLAARWRRRSSSPRPFFSR